MSLTTLFWICAGWVVLSVLVGLFLALLWYEKPVRTHDWSSQPTEREANVKLLAQYYPKFSDPATKGARADVMRRGPS